MLPMDVQARLLYLAEEKPRHTPYFLKRCVYAVAKKNGGGRDALDKAFAICVAQAQKRGDLKKGSMQVTKRGAAWSGTKKQEPSPFGFSVDKYDKLLARARQGKQTEAVSLAGMYVQLHEDLQLEQNVDEAGFRSSLQRVQTELTTLASAFDSMSLVSFPGALAGLLTHTLGRKGILGKLGIHGLLSAVQINPAEIAQDLEVMVKTFRNVVTSNVDWNKAKAKVRQGLSILGKIAKAKDDDGVSPEMVVSHLTDLYIVLGQLVQLFVDGIQEKRAKNAALVVRIDMRELSSAFMLLAGSA